MNFKNFIYINEQKSFILQMKKGRTGEEPWHKEADWNAFEDAAEGIDFEDGVSIDGKSYEVTTTSRKDNESMKMILKQLGYKYKEIEAPDEKFMKLNNEEKAKTLFGEFGGRYSKDGTEQFQYKFNKANGSVWTDYDSIDLTKKSKAFGIGYDEIIQIFKNSKAQPATKRM